MNYLSLFLILSILSGQIIKIPISNFSGLIILDFFVIFFTIFGLYKIKFKLKNPPLFTKIAIVFISIGLISLIITPLSLSSKDYLISFLYLARFFNYILFSWVVYSKAFGKLQDNLGNIFLFSGVGLAILGLLQLIFFPNLAFLIVNGWDPHVYRLVSTWLDPNFLGGFFCLTLLLILQLKENTRYLLFSLVFITLLATFSRSSIIFFFVSFLSYSLFNRSLKLVLLTILLSFILYLSIINIDYLIPKPLKADRQQSAQYRIGSWQTAIEIFKKSPIMGIGFNSYKFALKEYNLSSDDYIVNRSSTGSDSSLLFVAATTGILGLLTFIFLLVSLLFNSINNLADNKTGIIYFSGLVGLIIHSIFINSLFYPVFLLWIFLFPLLSSDKSIT